MNKIASLVLLIFGLILLAIGWDAYRSIGSDVARVFTGAPTDRSMLFLVGGGLLTASGLGGLARGTK